MRNSIAQLKLKWCRLGLLRVLVNLAFACIVLTRYGGKDKECVYVYLSGQKYDKLIRPSKTAMSIVCWPHWNSDPLHDLLKTKSCVSHVSRKVNCIDLEST